MKPFITLAFVIGGVSLLTITLVIILWDLYSCYFGNCDFGYTTALKSNMYFFIPLSFLTGLASAFLIKITGGKLE